MVMTIEELIADVVVNLATELDLDHGPFFFYGSPANISHEMNRTMNANSKYPAIILFNEFPVKQGDWKSHFGREANITLYFMQLAKANWSEAEHINNAISAQSLIADMFIEEIESDKRFGDVDDLTKINRSNWGLLVQNGGSKKSVFPDFLSGVEIKFTLKVKRDYC